MKIFLREHSIMHEISENHDVSQLDPVCEEALLDAFAKNKDDQ
jgi:hypothetical protein